jgi:hypothetical protein
MDERIERRPSWAPWAVGSLVLFIVAIVAFSAGQNEGAAASAAVSAPHWRWGFGGIGWIFVMFWIFGWFRWMSFGWGCGPRPWRYRRYYRRYYDDEYDDWRDWHRREHEKMSGSRPADHVG